MSGVLKPCPFCGGPATWVGSADGNYVECGACLASMPPHDDDVPNEEQRWNTRTPEPVTPEREGVRTWRHKARGTVYAEIGTAELQDAKGAGVEEGALLTIYRGEDGKLWARRASEFGDGRFERIITSAQPTPTDREARARECLAAVARANGWQSINFNLEHGPWGIAVQAMLSFADPSVPSREAVAEAVWNASKLDGNPYEYADFNDADKAPYRKIADAILALMGRK